MHTNAPSELPVQSLDEARMKRAAWAESNQRTVETSSLNPQLGHTGGSSQPSLMPDEKLPVRGASCQHH